jgi:hypothetical protein
VELWSLDMAYDAIGSTRLDSISQHQPCLIAAQDLVSHSLVPAAANSYLEIDHAVKCDLASIT